MLERLSLNLSAPAVMGVLNVTPDSFSDGGRFLARDHALAQAEQMIQDGAGIIDIGGESTRPGAQPVSLQQELDRVIPVISALADTFDTPISIDTSKPEVMIAAVNAGATMINDVTALQAPGAVEMAAQCQVPVCLMHMQGEPRSMQHEPHYTHVVDDVSAFLTARAKVCVAAGIPKEKIILDPGFGFGKTIAHNLSLVKATQQLVALGYPLLMGFSRKSTIGAVLDQPVDNRLAGSLSLAVFAASRGAHILRVHDVKPTVDALRMLTAVLASE